MKRPFALLLPLFCIAFGCGRRDSQPSDNIVREERYEQCNEDEADIRLDVKISRADEPNRVATKPFYLRKVNYVGFSSVGGERRCTDGVDSEGNSWYSHFALDLTDITLRDARFELSYLRAVVGKAPTVDIRVDVLVSLTEQTRRELESGIIVESSVTRLRDGKQHNNEDLTSRASWRR